MKKILLTTQIFLLCILFSCTDDDYTSIPQDINPVDIQTGSLEKIKDLYQKTISAPNVKSAPEEYLQDRDQLIKQSAETPLWNELQVLRQSQDTLLVSIPYKETSLNEYWFLIGVETGGQMELFLYKKTTGDNQSLIYTPSPLTGSLMGGYPSAMYDENGEPYGLIDKADFDYTSYSEMITLSEGEQLTQSGPRTKQGRDNPPIKPPLKPNPTNPGRPIDPRLPPFRPEPILPGKPGNPIPPQPVPIKPVPPGTTTPIIPVMPGPTGPFRPNPDKPVPDPTPGMFIPPKPWWMPDLSTIKIPTNNDDPALVMQITRKNSLDFRTTKRLALEITHMRLKNCGYNTLFAYVIDRDGSWIIYV